MDENASRMANRNWVMAAICYSHSFLKEETVRWIMFGIMMVFAVMTIVAKTWLYPSVYSMWILATLAFVLSFVEKTKPFVIRGLLYLFSIVLTLFVFVEVLKINSDTIPSYLPICTDLGISLGVGLEHLWLRWKEIFMICIESTLNSILNALRSERRGASLLPSHEPQSAQQFASGQLDYEEQSHE